MKMDTANENFLERSDESQDSNSVMLPMTILFDNLSTNSPQESDTGLVREKTDCVRRFERWSEPDQTDFIQGLLTKMSHCQHSQINIYLRPMLQRDFISLLPKNGLDHVAEKILAYLDGKSLCKAELVCHEWRRVISQGSLWKKLIEYNVHNNYIWKELSKRRGWVKFLFKNSSIDQRPSHTFYKRLYPQIVQDIENMEKNWRSGTHTLQKINCRSENSKGVYCLQYDDQKIVSGLRDNTIKVWDRSTLECKEVLTGHTGSVLCLQYDDNVIVSGSSDATVRVWDIHRGEMVSTLIHHSEAVLHLRFSNDLMVTCSKDRSIAVWDIKAPENIQLRRVLVGHRAAVNVVDFDEKYIVSASGDRTIKVWDTTSCEFIRTLQGHKRGIACLQYRDNLVVSGSSDNTIKLWDIESGTCLRTLDGHEELVRCIRFDNKRIVSGAYDGKIKVWDLKAALDPRSNETSLCLKTLFEHTGRVFRLQFDEFQIVSSSHDDTILIWDFLGGEPSFQPKNRINHRLGGSNGSNGNSNNQANNRNNNHTGNNNPGRATNDESPNEPSGPFDFYGGLQPNNVNAFGNLNNDVSNLFGPRPVSPVHDEEPAKNAFTVYLEQHQQQHVQNRRLLDQEMVNIENQDHVRMEEMMETSSPALLVEIEEDEEDKEHDEQDEEEEDDDEDDDEEEERAQQQNTSEDQFRSNSLTFGQLNCIDPQNQAHHNEAAGTDHHHHHHPHHQQQQNHHHHHHTEHSSTTHPVDCNNLYNMNSSSSISSINSSISSIRDSNSLNHPTNLNNCTIDCNMKKSSPLVSSSSSSSTTAFIYS